MTTDEAGETTVLPRGSWCWANCLTSVSRLCLPCYPASARVSDPAADG